MASLNTFLAETTSAIVSALDLSSLPVRRVFNAPYRGCEPSRRRGCCSIAPSPWGVRRQLMEPLLSEEGLADPTASPILEHVDVDVVTKCVALQTSLNEFL